MSKIKVLNGPDRHGRYTYALTWNDNNRAYCAYCGACRQRGCACVRKDKYTRRAQVFFGPLPNTALGRLRSVKGEQDGSNGKTY